MPNRTFRNIAMTFVLVSVVSMISLPFTTQTVGATPASQRLMLDGITMNDLYDNITLPGTTALDVMNNDTIFTVPDGNCYDSSPGVQWWLNASSAATGSWGIGSIAVTIADLTDEKADYYNISIFYTTQMMDSDESAINYNIGYYGYSEAISTRASVYANGMSGTAGYYTSTGIMPTDYPGQWAEEAKQSSTPSYRVAQWHLCTVTNNASDNRPWTADEVDGMTVIIDMRVDAGNWPQFSNYDVLPIRFCLIQLQVTAVPVYWYSAPPPAPGDYIPPTYITPDTVDYADAGVLGYLIPFMMIFILSCIAGITNREDTGTIVSVNIFLLSFSIGIAVLIWASVAPTYFILIPVGMLGIMLMRGGIGNE